MQRAPRPAEISRFSTDCELLFDLSMDMLWAATTSGILVRVNEAVTEFLGRGAEELVDRPFLDLVHEEDRSAIAEAVGHLPMMSAPLVCEGRIQARDGSWRWVEWRSIVVRVRIAVKIP